MKNAFDANVPKRKPRTRLRGILDEIDTDQNAPVEAVLKPVPASPPPPAPVEVKAETPPPLEAMAPEVCEEPVPELPAVHTSAPAAWVERPVPAPRVVPAPSAEVPEREEPAPRVVAPKAVAEPSPPPAAPAGRPRVAAPGGEVVLAGRARIAELRARLETSAERHEANQAEPAATAVRIRETMASLRSQLRDMSEERARLIESLELTRRELAETERALDGERRAREDADRRATERHEVAEQLLAESEALAEERDEALGRIVELRELDTQQADLVDEMQRRMLQLEDDLERARHDVREVRGALEVAEGELAAVQARLDARTLENERLHERIRALENDLQSTTSAREALVEIQKLVDSLG